VPSVDESKEKGWNKCRKGNYQLARRNTCFSQRIISSPSRVPHGLDYITSMTATAAHSFLTSREFHHRYPVRVSFCSVQRIDEDIPPYET
jgi:hypothetical protein